MIVPIKDDLKSYIVDFLEIDYDLVYTFLSLEDGKYTLMDYFGYDTPATKTFNESDYQEWLKNKKV